MRIASLRSALGAILNFFLNFLMDFLWPRRCLVCGDLLSGAEKRQYPLCAGCEASLRPIGEPRCFHCGKTLISEVHSCMMCRGGEFACSQIIPLFRYEGPVAALMSAYKKGQRLSLARFWAALVEEELRTRWPKALIVPVPPRPEKARAGEIDQIERIVRIVERHGFTVARLLARAASAQQKTLSRSGRLANSQAAYSLKKAAQKSHKWQKWYNQQYSGHSAQPASSPMRTIVLVDDVYTTGATIEACARALRIQCRQTGGAEQGAAIVALLIAAD